MTTQRFLWVAFVFLAAGCGAGTSETVLTFFTTSSTGADMGVAHSDFGGDAIAQSFQVSENATTSSVKLVLKKTGSFAAGSGHTVQLFIDSDNSDSPLGTPVTNGSSSTVSVDNISSTASQIRFTFSTPVSLTANTTYWLRLRASYAVNNTNFIQWVGYDGPNGYSSGRAIYKTGAGTFSSSAIGLLRDLNFVVVQ